MFNLLKQRNFAPPKKSKRGGKKDETLSDAEATGAEGEPAHVEEDQFAAARHGKLDELHLDKELFQPFTVGDVKKI